MSAAWKQKNPRRRGLDLFCGHLAEHVRRLRQSLEGWECILLAGLASKSRPGRLIAGVAPDGRIIAGTGMQAFQIVRRRSNMQRFSQPGDLLMGVFKFQRSVETRCAVVLSQFGL